MKQVNRRIAFYTRPYPRARSWFAIIDEAVRVGMPYIEGINHYELREPDLDTARALRAYADEKGVRFGCLSCFCNFTPENTEAQIARMKTYIDMAQILGAPYFHHTLVAGYETPEEVQKNREILFENAVGAVRRLYDYGQTKGIRLIFEDQGYLFNGVENFSRFLDTVDRNVGVLLDTGNTFNVDEEPEEFLEAFLPRICHVHLKDVVYAPTSEGMLQWIRTLKGNFFWPVPLGQGRLPLEKIVRRLEKAGYSGLYALEYGAPSDDSPVMTETMATLSDWLEKE